jgi:polyphosphate kinase
MPLENGPIVTTGAMAAVTHGSPSDSSDALDIGDPRLYINRELSWLAFNDRVLAHAHSDTHPLLDGVPINGIVRGICCLRPGLPGVSDLIQVRSVVGRFLEHSRVYAFENGGSREIYLGSADLMERNLDRRVEVLCPVLDPAIRDEIGQLLRMYLRDDTRATALEADGQYEPVQMRRTGSIDAQEMLMAARLPGQPSSGARTRR